MIEKVEFNKYIPVYICIAQHIKQNIMTNKFDYKKPIVAESQLAKQYGVSLGTMRKAVQVLVNEKYLIRKQGVGTFIAKAKFDLSMFNCFYFNDKHLSEKVPNAKILDKKIIPATADIADKLNISLNNKVIYLERLRLLDNIVVQYENIYVPYDIFSPLMSVENQNFDMLLYPMYEKITGNIIASAKEFLSIVKPNNSVAGQLNISTSDTVVALERISKNHAGDILEWRCFWGDSRNFKYSININ